MKRIIKSPPPYARFFLPPTPASIGSAAVTPSRARGSKEPHAPFTAPRSMRLSHLGVFAAMSSAGFAFTLMQAQAETPYAETVHENALFLAKREGNDVKFYSKANQKCVLVFRIYGHDNRLEASQIDFADISAHEKADFSRFLQEVLNEKICGKVFISNAKEADKPIFNAAGFSFDPASAEKTRRVATARASTLKSIPTAVLPRGFAFKTNIDPAMHAERLMELAAGSGFLPEKIQDYMAKGMSGLLAMQQETVARPTIFDENGRVVACCTLSCPAYGPAYIADTWVDEKVFGSKAIGTAFLYQHIGATQPAGKKIHLIMAPNREAEFRSYGFETPVGEIGVAFQAAGPYLAHAFAWQKEQAVKERRQGYADDSPPTVVEDGRNGMAP